MSAASRSPGRAVRVLAVALSSGAAVLLALLGFGPGTGLPPGLPRSAAVTTPAGVSVSITDNQPSARAGESLTYQATVTNSGTQDIQLLLEISVPAGAQVTDAGGGTIRQTLIDYGITALARTHVPEKFTITVGRLTPGEQRIATVASVYVLGGADSGATPTVAATDSDVVTGAGSAGAHPAAAVATGVADRASPRRASGPAHEGLWIAALVIGALLVIGGVALAVGSGAGAGLGAGLGAGAAAPRRRPAAPHVPPRRQCRPQSRRSLCTPRRRTPDGRPDERPKPPLTPASGPGPTRPPARCVSAQPARPVWSSSGRRPPNTPGNAQNLPRNGAIPHAERIWETIHKRVPSPIIRGHYHTGARV